MYVSLERSKNRKWDKSTLDTKRAKLKQEFSSRRTTRKRGGGRGRKEGREAGRKEGRKTGRKAEKNGKTEEWGRDGIEDFKSQVTGIVEHQK